MEANKMDMIRNVAEKVLILLGFLGNVFVWFESDWGARRGNELFVLYIGAVLVTMVSSSFVPQAWGANLRTVGMFLFVNTIESVICTANYYMALQHEYLRDVTADQVRLMRCGYVMVLLPCALLFFASVVFSPVNIKDKRASTAELRSVRGAFFLAAAVCFFVAQSVIWSIDKACQVVIPNSNILNGIPFMFAVLLVASLATADRDLQDFTVYLVLVRLTWAFKTIFDHNVSVGQLAYPHIWRAEQAYGLIACLLVLAGALQHAARFGRSGKEAAQAVSARVTTQTFPCLIGCFLIGFAGAICVFSRSPAPNGEVTYETQVHNWAAVILGLIVPAMCIISWLTSARGFALIALMVATYPVSHNMTWQSYSGGYLRGGNMMVVFAALASTLLALTEGASLAARMDAYVTDANLKQTLASVFLVLSSMYLFAVRHTAYIMVLFSAVLLFRSISAGSHASSKFVVFYLLNLLCGMFFPLSQSFATSAYSMVFVVIGWGVVLVEWQRAPGATFDVLHEVSCDAADKAPCTAAGDDAHMA
jgi:hypothetical protein